jgi:glucose/arabinose dehydrogenase
LERKSGIELYLIFKLVNDRLTLKKIILLIGISLFLELQNRLTINIERLKTIQMFSCGRSLFIVNTTTTTILALTILLLIFVPMGYYYIPHANATIEEDDATTTEEEDDATTTEEEDDATTTEEEEDAAADTTDGGGDTTCTDVRCKAEIFDEPIIHDPNLEIQQVVEGLELPTNMAFLGPNDILVLEKDKGTVQRIINGIMQVEPVLDVNVANANERGMVGIAVEEDLLGSKSSSSTTNTYVFVYFTESEADGNDECTSSAASSCDPSSPQPLGNRLYRYELINDKLVNPMLLLDLPATPGPAHNGGAIKIGPDNNVYIPIGDVRMSDDPQEAESLDGRAGILRVTQNGEVVDGKGILGDEDPLNKYYAYGIRNSFGIDFDPVTGKLWDTENGPSDGDEINLVEPGFNSGWQAVKGMSSDSGDFDPEADLASFDGKAKYSDPEFAWEDTIGPTAIKFLDSDKLGTEYQNDIFVGDVHAGNIYNFKLNEDRTGLLALDANEEEEGTSTEDDVLAEEESSIVFGQGFGGITDLEVGPDGYLYVVSIGLGKIFKIVPTVNNEVEIASNGN